MVARQQSAEFSHSVAKDLRDVETKLRSSFANDDDEEEEEEGRKEELFEMLKQTLEEAKAFAANAEEEAKRAMREVGVDATRVDAMGDDDDRKEKTRTARRSLRKSRMR